MRDLSSIPASWARLGAGAALLALTLGAYASVFSAEFVNYDDRLYVTENPWILQGLSWDGISWAFTTYYATNWHPLTWLSFLLDYELFGDNAGGYHATNLVLHLLTTVLLMLWLERVTGSLGKSAFVAGVFALHPMHVESVAWIAERKDVLSGLFLVLTLWVYVWAVRERSVARMALVAVVFALGLMTKPMLVTLPLVLLLVDHWPLDRLRSEGGLDWARVRAAVLEKIPLFVLSAGSAVITIRAAADGAALASLRQTSVLERLFNSFYAYSLYVGKATWPTDMIAFYPHVPGSVSASTAFVAAVGVVLITALALQAWRRAPYFAVGWLWFVVTLIPVIGLVKVGGQLIADRYTYIPFIGLAIVVAWGVPALLAGWPQRRAALAAAAVCALIAMTVVSRQQAELWQNSETLMGHMLAVSPNNPIAYHQLALVHFEAGRTDEAERHFRGAIEIAPTFWEAQLALGTLLFNQGRTQEGARHLDLALTHNSSKGMLARNTVRRRTLACVAILQLAQAGNSDRAIEHFSFLLAYAPSVLRSPEALSPILLDNGDLGEHARAVVHAEILREPGLYGARLALAEAMYAQGDARRAVSHYDFALEQQRDLLTLNNLAWILATDNDPSVRDPDRAVRLAEEAVALGGDANPGLLDTLAIAYDRAGRADAASATRQRAARITSQRSGS